MQFCWVYPRIKAHCRGVAQPGRVLAWGARGRRFDSCHPDQKFKPVFTGFNFCLCVFGIDTSSLRLQWLVRKQVDFANKMQQNRYGFPAGRQPKELPVTPTTLC